MIIFQNTVMNSQCAKVCEELRTPLLCTQGSGVRLLALTWETAPKRIPWTHRSTTPRWNEKWIQLSPHTYRTDQRAYVVKRVEIVIDLGRIPAKRSWG